MVAMRFLPNYINTVILFSAKMAEIHLKMVEYAQFSSNGRTYAKIGRNVSKLAEFHPNRRKQTSHGSNFDQIERNSTKKGGRI
jgi:hypothetical protein